MTERLSDITDRIDGIRQLGAVVSAMRGIAAARAEQARSQIAAVDSYAASIAAAIGQISGLARKTPAQADGKAARLALVVFCAEQGFAGAFSERVLDQAGADLATSDVFLIGTRGRIAITERDVVPVWTAALPSHSPGIPKLADTIGTALYARIAKGEIDRLDAIYNQWQPGKGTEVQRRRLFPLDLTLFPEVKSVTPPLLNLPPDDLIRALTADYLHAQLCRAAFHAFAAENEARIQAMAAARNQVERQLTALEARQRLVRQEEITAEVIELAAGETASRPG